MAPSSLPSRLPLSFCVLFAAVTTAACLPHSSQQLPHSPFSKRHDLISKFDNGTFFVPDPVTQQPLPQGSASDGGGSGFDAPAIIWLVWSFAVGGPLLLAGIRLSRVTTGFAIGTTCTLLVWASFINTLDATGISDTVLTALSMGAFGAGLIFGALNVGRIAGITLLGILGGFSIGVRVILFRPGLLVPEVLYVNWLIITIFGILGFLLVLLRQRAAITGGSAAVGSFLVALGIDLVINQQSGMSQGLRFLFDRNNAHLVDLFTEGWHPPISTEAVMAVSLGTIIPFALIQHYVFKQPFKRVRSNSLASLIDQHDTPRNSGNSTKMTRGGDVEETETLRADELLEKGIKDVDLPDSPIVTRERSRIKKFHI